MNVRANSSGRLRIVRQFEKSDRYNTAGTEKASPAQPELNDESIIRTAASSHQITMTRSIAEWQDLVPGRRKRT